MTGPEHYAHAEQLIGDASRADGIIVMPNPQTLAAAQVHATLALAAATALNDAQGAMGDRDWHEWMRAASVTPPAEWPVNP